MSGRAGVWTDVSEFSLCDLIPHLQVGNWSVERLRYVKFISVNLVEFFCSGFSKSTDRITGYKI